MTESTTLPGTAAAANSLGAPRLQEAIARLCAWVETREFRGYDPYDALKSPVLRALSLGLKWPRIAFTQTLRRLPWNVRPVLGIRRGRNPKGLGLFLSSYVRLHRMGVRPHALDVCDRLVAGLEATVSPGRSGACWGYDFPWQSRSFYVPVGVPTVVNTSFVGQALLDHHEATSDPRTLALARSACEFVRRDLHRYEDATGLCFSYTPVDRTQVHNANALAAAFLARCGARTGERELLDDARACARFLLARQRADGSWFYANTSYQAWVDSFHTGFVIDSLLDIARYAGVQQDMEPVRRAFRFFCDRFLEPSGAVRFYHDSLHPLDVHCPTQAMVTLTKAWPLDPQPERLGAVLTWFLERMASPEGWFYYRIHRSGRPNRIPYMRWGQAWALHALTTVAMHGAETLR